MVIVQLRRRTGLPCCRFEQELQRAVEDADLVGQRHRPVPLMEVHADVEVERPVGLGGHHAGIAPQLAVALVDDDEIALGLAGDVFERLHRQGGGIAEGEGLVDAQRPVDPAPLVAVLVQREDARGSLRPGAP